MSEDKFPHGAMPPEPQEPDKVVEPKEKQVDYEKSFKELQQKFGEHSNLVGDLRSQNEALATKVSEIEQSAAAREKEALNAEPPTDYEKMLADVADQYDNGDISYKDSLLETNRITREMTKAEAEQEKTALLDTAKSEVQKILSEKDNEVVVGKFYENNPDFLALQESGDLQKVMEGDPLLDDLSAYYKLQAEQAFEKGKAEQSRIESGSNPASKVLADPGSSMQNDKKPTKLTGEAAVKESMLASLGG